MTTSVRTAPSGTGSFCRVVLASLPEWFAIREANEAYIELTDRTPTYVASIDQHDVGVAHIEVHSPRAAELDLLALLPGFHRRGIGRELLAAVECDLLDQGVEFLTVTTLSATHSSEYYRRTREFYFSCGFFVLEELPELWGPENPAILLRKALG